MPGHTSPQPYISTQEAQGIVIGLSGGCVFVRNPQASYTPSNLSHPRIEFPSDFPTGYDRPQNSALKNDQNDSTEVGFGTQQHRFLPALCFCPPADWDWHNEAESQRSHGLPENQIWDPVGQGFLIQGSADTRGYADESDATISGQTRQSSPPLLRNYNCDVAVSPSQPSHGASYRTINPDLYLSTPRSLSGTTWNIRQYSRYQMENCSTSSPSGTPPTPLLAGTELNVNPDRPIAHPNHQPPRNRRRAQQRNKQDIVQRKRPSASCEGCGVRFKRAGDLRRHLTTTKAHSPAKGPFCPEKDCKYSNERFTRADNLLAHLINIHEVDEAEAARYIQRWKDEVIQYRFVVGGCLRTIHFLSK